MRMRARGVVGLGPLVLFAAMAIMPSIARAEADTFGVGDGADGAHTAGAAGETVNVYAAVGADVAAGATSIPIQDVVPGGGAFAVGDLLLVWRATGVGDMEAGAASGDQAAVTLGSVSGGAVGKFEFAKVSGVGASTLTVSAPLVSAWAKDLTQVVKVPRYTTVSVPNGTSMAAAPWQQSGTGFAGGVLAFLANDAVTIDSGGKLDADATGFRGGVKVQRTTLVLDCPNDDGTVQQGYAPKGEGVVASKFGSAPVSDATDSGGKGNRSIAAGGGNCVENGGGGGGNFGGGGHGGSSTAVGNMRGGLGGAALTYSLLARVSLGGGGGAGEQKNTLGSSGGQGGGSIFVRAKSLAIAGAVSANGENAANATLLGVDSDGAGGGGAGGSILLRIVDDVTCAGGGVIQANGGNGGSTEVVGLSLWGPGGGGGGGRVLVQAKTNGCTPSTAAGAAGQSGGVAKDATSGSAGATEPAIKPGSMGVTSGYCFSNPTSNPQCTAAQPVCDVTSGFCDKCNGAFGSGASSACPESKPVCATDGSCNPCTADFPDPNGCQTNSLQTCVLTGPNQGQCIKCTSNMDCVGHENRTQCDTVSGACGTACMTDADCSNVEWCTGAHVCIPKTPNGDPVPNEDPIDGNCTPDNGRRACLSGVCEMSDNECGLKNGDPCNGAGECRSDICFTDGDCGLPFGQPCSSNMQCRSDKCENGTCTGCVLDKDCGLGLICDTTQMQCVAGCKSDQNCPPPQVCTAHDGSVGQCVSPPASDAGVTDGGFVDTSGIVEGGGCSCRTASLADAGRPLGIGGLAAAVLLFVRRRKNRST